MTLLKLNPNLSILYRVVTSNITPTYMDIHVFPFYNKKMYFKKIKTNKQTKPEPIKPSL